MANARARFRAKLPVKTPQSQQTKPVPSKPSKRPLQATPPILAKAVKRTHVSSQQHGEDQVPDHSKWWDLLLKFGDACPLFVEYQELQPTEASQYRLSFLQGFAHLEPRTLNQRWNAWSRWSKFTDTHGSPERQASPTPVLMSEYLASLARQAHRHVMLLSWVARRFQLQLHLTHPIVSPWATPQSSTREPKQQPPFRIKEIAHLESL
eukprot:5035693-Amphidinium_carterae.1